jgi:LPXTG-site transpeptidase (sortase) family protein
MANTKRSLKKGIKSVKNIYIAQFLLSILLVLVGAGLLFKISVDKYVNTVSLPNDKIEAINSNIDTLSRPEKIYIPSLSKTLYISDGYALEDRWVISETGVSFLTTSAVPGIPGNTVIYGHNTKNILGGLPNIKNGDSIYIILKSGEFIKYEASETKEVNPNQVEILNSTADSRLTIYTCSGFLDQARFIVVAKEVNTI